MISESHFEKDRWRMPLIAYERPVNYPLETSVFDINSTSVIRTSSNDGADEGWILDYQRLPTIYGIFSKKVYVVSGRITEVSTAKLKFSGKATQFGMLQDL